MCRNFIKWETNYENWLNLTLFGNMYIFTCKTTYIFLKIKCVNKPYKNFSKWIVLTISDKINETFFSECISIFLETHVDDEVLTLYKVVGNYLPPPVSEIHTRNVLLCFSSFHLMTKIGKSFRKETSLNVLVVS